MARLQRFSLGARCVAAALMVCFAGVPAARAETKTPFVVVVNKSRPETDITRRELTKIYLGDKKFWAGGNPVQPVLPPKTAAAAKDRLVSMLTGMSPAEFGLEWEGKVFRGESTHPPVILTTEKETIGYLFMIPNAIAIIPAEALGKYEKVVKVLSVDGKKPGDEGYGLQALD